MPKLASSTLLYYLRGVRTQNENDVRLAKAYNLSADYIGLDFEAITYKVVAEVWHADGLSLSSFLSSSSPLPATSSAGDNDDQHGNENAITEAWRHVKRTLR